MLGCRREGARLGGARIGDQVMSRLESVMGEPGAPGLGEALDRFWSAWSDLSNEPEDPGYRIVLVEAAEQLCRDFRSAAVRIGEVRRELNEEVAERVNDINEYAEQIGRLNQRIFSAEVGGEVAADLRDTRDRLLDRLSELADISVHEAQNGTFKVYLSGKALVEGPHVSRLSTLSTTDGNGNALVNAVWEESGRELRIANGELKSLLDHRDTQLPDKLAALDLEAAVLVEELNALHREGYDLYGSLGIDFFDPAGATASEIRLSQALADDPDRIAASADGSVGNADQALAIAGLGARALDSLQGRSIEDLHGTLLAEIGARARSAKTELESQTTFVMELKNRRESYSGVNLDEEMTVMLMQEQAYQAASRVIAMADEMIATLLELV